MEAQANTTRAQSNKKSMEVGDPRMGNGGVGKKGEKFDIKLSISDIMTQK